ncbi:MAG: ATP-binding protein [Ignavibacteriaceae bacterium]
MYKELLNDKLSLRRLWIIIIITIIVVIALLILEIQSLSYPVDAADQRHHLLLGLLILFFVLGTAYIIASTLNITKTLKTEIKKRNQIEKELLKKNEFLNTTIESLTHPFYVLDANDYSIIIANAATNDFISTANPKCYAVTHRRDKPCGGEEHKCPLQIVKRTKKATTVEHTHYDKLGNERVFEVHGHPIFDEDGNVIQMIEYTIDITERKKLERQLADSLEKEKELSDLKSRFISTTSHEFRTPLTSILGTSDLLEMVGQDLEKEKYDVYIKRIQDAAVYMKDLINDVLTVSRVETGKQNFSPSRIDVISLAKEVIDEVEVLLLEKHDFQFNNTTAEKFVYLDENLIKSILLNLLSNAIKYSPDGDKITFNIEFVDSTILFMISDEGIGIPGEDQDKLFEPFHRGKNIGNISGTGLGLSIVDKLVELHSGKIYCESKLNSGTKFTIKIPVKQDEN